MESERRAQASPSGAKGEETSFFRKAPVVSVPKGGGAIRGIGEKFTTNPVTGTASITVPIATSPGRSGFGPALSLAYDSGSGNGPFGLGWTLSLPAITRKTDRGLPAYLDRTESDVFLLAGAEDLVPELRGDGSRYEDTSSAPGYRIHRYRPRIEGLFARIERWTRIDDPGDVHWRSLSRENVLTVYGKDADSRITDPDEPGRIFSWVICEMRDDRGNAVVYDYKPEDGAGVDLAQSHERNRGNHESPKRSANRYLKCIRYGNRTPLLARDGRRPRFLSPADRDRAGWMFEVVFDYGEGHLRALPVDALGRESVIASASESGGGPAWPVRSDPFSSYRSGFEVRTYRLCRRVLMFHHFPGELGVADCLVRTTEFTYEETPSASFMTAVIQSGYVRAGDHYRKRSLPPLEFKYSEAVTGQAVHEVDPLSIENLPQGADGSSYQWVDLDGEGLSGILTEQGSGWCYKRNESAFARDLTTDHYSARFAPLEAVASIPAGDPLTARGAQLLDLAGDGQLDVVELDRPIAGFYERTSELDWESFRPFQAMPNLAWNDPNLKFLDLTGDGRADVLITGEEAFTWYPSMAEDGFGPAERVAIPTDEEQGPRIVFADGTETIFLADLSGDGLTDVVRIRNGEICYWPNRGYGRFGAKVSMDNAPWFDHPDHFDPRRIRLADIDGTGPTDIIYLGRNDCRFWFNQSGNAWSAAQELPAFPPVDNVSSVAAVDLFGNGTGCLVWSSPLPGESRAPMRYLELMAQGKPHLLVKTGNNLGAETEIRYAPSTYFYLRDKYTGRPWVTRLPFPVHCVEKVTVTDRWRNTRFSTTYSYHHGYFDGEEREFRGFGRVEQIDVEDFGTFAAGNTESPYITADHTLYQPPVKTITWFHTGANIDRERMLSQFREEYFQPDGFAEHELPEPDLAAEALSTEEWREALRACKGRMLRQEVYELDVDALAERAEERPVKLFATACHNCQIHRLQPRGANRHAVFMATESEAITYHYELDLRAGAPPDPRIAHTLNLRVDEFGHVLQSIAAVYPRSRHYEDRTLDAADLGRIHAVQGERHLIYTETCYTHDVDDPADLDNYRLRVPCEVLTYELTGIRPEEAGDGEATAPIHYFTLDELRGFRLSDVHQTAGHPVTEIGYHLTPSRRNPEKRTVEHVCMLYFRDDLTGPLPLGALAALGLPYETYKLALTEELLAAVLGDKLSDPIRADLNERGLSGYLSGDMLDRRFPGRDNAGQYWIRSGIAGFARDAARHFYLPERFSDPFGNITTLRYDERDLFIRFSSDPVGNTVTVTRFDYRVLAPREIRDINGNLSEVRFDTLGLPAAIALKGKGSEGDNLEGMTDELIDPDAGTRSAFFAGEFSGTEARRLLGNATARHVYHFGEERASDGTLRYGAHPPCAAAILREQHVAALTRREESPLQVAFEYSDGGGNVLVKKAQAEPAAEGGPLRWIASGKTVLNNKGKPVKQYEPYFSETGHRFDADEAAREVGVTPIMYYDAPGRLVRTELPDGAYSRVEFSPWQVTSYDPNDTVREPGNAWYVQKTAPSASAQDQRAARLAAEHAGTPATVFLDSLGREVVSVAHNRVPEDLPGSRTPLLDQTWRDEKYITFTKLDTEGKPLWIRDARGNLVMQYIAPPKPTMWAAEPNEDILAASVPCYDLAGNLLFQHSMDGGDRWMLSDAAGQAFYAWDENEAVQEGGEMQLQSRVFHTVYDPLRRPLEHRLVIDGGEPQTIERLIYGESHAEAAARNLRGQVYRHYDPSGLITNERFDFKGNPLEVTRRLASNYQAPVIHWPDDLPDSAFEAGIFTQRTEYDALNRMTGLENWHLAGRAPAIYSPQYNPRGLLSGESLSVRGKVTAAIASIEYNAKGQRTRIDYGNRTTTRYAYDPATFRLVSLVTTNISGSQVFQNLAYTYDAVGNITHIRDEAQQTLFFRNRRVEPNASYTYDALYRLIEATGREHLGLTGEGQPNPPTPPDQFNRFHAGHSHPHDGNAMGIYVERYFYDAVGNIDAMRHQGSDRAHPGWTRHYRYAEDSNRLLRTWLGDDEVNAVRYGYDTHGSMQNLANVPDEYRLRWDYRDMIHQVNLGGGGQAWYGYDAQKQRTRKRIEHNGSMVEERFYLGGMEYYRRRVGSETVEEIETHHLFVEDQRVLIVEDVVGTDNSLDSGTLYRYQYGNHLGSVGLELDEDAAVISYEEYHPYGTTAYQAKNAAVRATAKRYRYTGMERDEETGLSYHTARYYLPWLGRWGTIDPIGITDGTNLYQYNSGSPTDSTDPTGTQSRRDAVRFARALHAIDPNAFSGGVSIYNGRWIPTPNSLAEHPLLQGVAAQARSRLLGRASLPTDPHELYAAYRTELNALIRADVNSGGPLASLFEIAQRGEGTQLRFRSGVFAGQWLEHAHDISRAEIARYGASSELAIDLANLSPVGAGFHRAFLHLEQLVTRHGRLTPEAVRQFIRQYATEVGSATSVERSLAAGTSAAVVGSAGGGAGSLIGETAGSVSTLGIFGGIAGVVLAMLTVEQLQSAQTDSERAEIVVDIGLPLGVQGLFWLIGSSAGAAAGFGVGAVIAVSTRAPTSSHWCERYSDGCGALSRYLQEYPHATEEDLQVLHGLLELQQRAQYASQVCE